MAKIKESSFVGKSIVEDFSNSTNWSTNLGPKGFLCYDADYEVIGVSMLPELMGYL
jgi:hypothetical protein